MKRVIGAMTVAVSLFMAGCGEIGMSNSVADEAVDQMANVVQADDPHVLSVKNGHPNAYPDKTYGEAFEEFFGSPTWKYFVGTKEGPDEDGDGKPDYTIDDVDVVEFTGYCVYRDVSVKALIQFTLNNDDDTFEATYLSFNDVPQNMLMLAGLLSKAFEDEETESNNGSSTNIEEQNREPATSQTQNTNEDVSGADNQNGTDASGNTNVQSEIPQIAGVYESYLFDQYNWMEDTYMNYGIYMEITMSGNTLQYYMSATEDTGRVLSEYRGTLVSNGYNSYITDDGHFEVDYVPMSDGVDVSSYMAGDFCEGSYYRMY